MIGSMYSGVAGLQAHRTSMDVIGNDIANVNTVAYKQSDITFKEAFVNTLRSPLGGMPGMHVGTGVQVAQITRDFSGGSLIDTGRSSNLAVSGNGFFVVANPASPTTKHLTRAGDFTLDVNGGQTFLITPEGHRLHGVVNPAGDTTVPDVSGNVNGLTEITLPPNTTAFSIGRDGVLRVSIDGGEMEVRGRVALAQADNPNGLKALGSNLYEMTDVAGIRTLSNPGSGGNGQIFQGYLENSNVDLAREFTEMILTQRGFQANSKTITTSDEMIQEGLSIKR